MGSRRLAALRRDAPMTRTLHDESPTFPRTPNDLRDLRSALDRQRLLPELLPAPVRRPSHVHDGSAYRAPAAPAHLPGAGPLVFVAPRLRHPPPAAPRLLGHRSRSALALELPQCNADDDVHQASVRRIRLPPRGARGPVPRRLSGMEAHRRDALPVVGDADRLGRALLGAVFPLRNPRLAVGAA